MTNLINLPRNKKELQKCIVFFLKKGTRKGTIVTTSRVRAKSAPYPRLKHSKKTSKGQVFSFTVPENRKFYEKNFSKKNTYSKNGPTGALKSHNAEKLKGDPLRFFNIHSVAKHQKIEGGKNF